MAEPTTNTSLQNPPPSPPSPPPPQTNNHNHHHQHNEQQNKEEQGVTSLVKFSVFVGIFLLRVLDGIPWVWGNLGVYVTSYYYIKGDESSGSSTNWLITINSSAFNFGMLLGGLIRSKIGIRLTLLLALVTHDLGLVMSYFALQSSAVALCITFGAMAGLAGGIVENCQLTLVVRWTDRYQGLAASSVPSSNILGAVLVNWILTFFINPSNYETNGVKDGEVIFTQADLIKRVPYSFVLFGCLSFTVSFIGFLLIRINRGDKNIVFELISRVKKSCCFGSGSSSREEEVRTLILKKEETVTVRYASLSNENENDEDDETEHKDCLRHEPEMEDTAATATTSAIIDNVDNVESNMADMSQFHLTPREAVKTRRFYVLLVFNMILGYAFFTLNTYYKTFGLLYIPDDHFLTVVVMVKCFATPVCTWIAGFCVDKFGVKPTIVTVSSVFCILAAFFDLTVVNKWLYLFSTVLYGCSLFSLFCLTSACCVKLFGQTHFSTIFGLMLTMCNVLTFAIPPLTHWIVAVHGWMVLFSSVGVLALCQVFVLVLGLPEKHLFEPFQR